MPFMIPFIPLIAAALPMVLQATGALGGNEDGGDSGGNNNNSNAGGSYQAGPGAGAAAAMAPSGASVAAQQNPTDYRQSENAYWQQLFAGTGQGLPGGQLPQGIQENIDKQASLLGEG